MSLFLLSRIIVTLQKIITDQKDATQKGHYDRNIPLALLLFPQRVYDYHLCLQVPVKLLSH